MEEAKVGDLFDMDSLGCEEVDIADAVVVTVSNFLS